MIEKNKKHNRGSISEEDVSFLTQRYSSTTVLTLLHELAQIPERNFDWNALVKSSSTGISSAREYHMLWRHLAYRHPLLNKLNDGAEPLDDDSDLEYELEPSPSVSAESSTEAAACVKVLIDSGLPSEASVQNTSTVEAPLTIKLPTVQSSRACLENAQPACSTRGMYITVPVSVQRHPPPAPISTEPLDANGTTSANMPSKRKRKAWSEAEDLELIAAVQKCGEGNWANILRGDFKGDRTASQLSQRWAIIRKRNGNLNVGGNSTGSQLSEAQLAARHAMSVALNMPVGNLVSGSTITTSNLVQPPTPPIEASLQAQSQSKQTSTIPTKSPPTKPPRVTMTNKTPANAPFSYPDAIVRATAVAAGARIASPSDAASLFKAAQAKNAIHIMPKALSSDSHPNVQNILTGKSFSPLSSYPPVVPKPGSGQHNPFASSTSLNMPPSKPVGCSAITESPLKQKGNTTAEESRVYEQKHVPKEEPRGNETETQNYLSEKVEGEKSALEHVKAEVRVVENGTANDNGPLKKMETIDSDSKPAKDNNQVEVELRENTNETEVVISENEPESKGQSADEKTQ